MSQDNSPDLPEPPETSEEPASKPVPTRLQEAIRKARLSEAERSDVIVDLREAETARLELLKDALSDVFESIPPDNDLLECALIPGSPPRLWIDVLAHVSMGRDKRTYRFIKDTRYGRQVIFATTRLEEMADRVTDYVAHRLIERQRALESDAEQAAVQPVSARHPEPERTRARRAGFGWGTLLMILILGLLLGAAGLFAGALLIVSL